MNREISIGLLCDYMHNPFHTEIIAGLSEAAQKKGAKLWCFEFSVDSYDRGKISPQTFNALIEKRNLNAFVILPGTLEPYLQTQKILSYFQKEIKLPVIALFSPHMPVPSIRTDNTEGMKKLLFHLIAEHGYRRLAFITGINTISDFNRRYRDFISICHEYGIHIDDSNIFKGNFSFDCGRNAVLEIIKANIKRFDGIVAANDQIAAGALLELRNQGISVPREIALTGFDDTKSALYTDPPITTVRQPLYDISFTAIDYIFDILAGRSVPEKTIVHPQLIIRRSCGCSINERTDEKQHSDEQQNKILPISYEKRDIIAYEHTFIDRIIRYLGNHYAEPDLYLKDIEKAAGISQKKITRLISKKFHMSYKKLLNKIRCTEAKRLLEKTDIYITDIAFQVGYNSRTHFCRAFTGSEGISPREYRRRHLT